MKHNLILSSILLLLTTGTLTQKYCLEYPTFNEELQYKYCGSAIKWPVQTDMMLDDTLHDQALLKYKEVYQEYIKEPDNKNQYTGITVDCLGIVRKGLCAQLFPYCVTNDATSEQVHISDFTGAVSAVETENTNTAREGESSFGVCKSLCSLIEARCPTMPQIYEEMCKDMRNDNCAISGRIQVWGLLMAVLVNLIW